MRRIAVFIVAAGFVAAVGCEDSPPVIRTNPAEVAKAQLAGGWQLKRACGGEVFRCHIADSLPDPARYEFRADDSVEAYRGGVDPVYVTDYSIVAGASGGGSDTRPTIFFGSAPDANPRTFRMEFRDNLTLLLEELGGERLVYEYNRLPP